MTQPERRIGPVRCDVRVEIRSVTDDTNTQDPSRAFHSTRKRFIPQCGGRAPRSIGRLSSATDPRGRRTGSPRCLTSDNKTLRRLRQAVRQVPHNHLSPRDTVISKQTDDLFRNGEQLIVSLIEPNTRSLSDVPGCVSLSCKLSLPPVGIVRRHGVFLR